MNRTQTRQFMREVGLHRAPGKKGRRKGDRRIVLAAPASPPVPPTRGVAEHEVLKPPPLEAASGYTEERLASGLIAVRDKSAADVRRD